MVVTPIHSHHQQILGPSSRFLFLYVVIDKGREVSACLYVCLFVCISARICRKTQSMFYQIFCTCYLWTWLRSSSDGIVIRCVLPVLWITSSFHIIKRMVQNQSQRVCFVQFARWRHQSGVRQLCFVKFAAKVAAPGAKSAASNYILFVIFDQEITIDIKLSILGLLVDRSRDCMSS